MKVFVVAFFLLIVAGSSEAQELKYKNPALPVSVRVDDLLSRMTVEEKFWQLFMIPGNPTPAEREKYKDGLFGFQMNTGNENHDAAGQMITYKPGEERLVFVKKANDIQRYFVEQTRLGIPLIIFDEALHGLVTGHSTVYPQSIALAASWDTSLMRKVAGAIASEAKSCGIRQVLSPVLNIASDVRWGRTEETYGEDPFLCSEMGVAFVREFENRNIIATPKHFIANVGDGGRDSYPVFADERLLNELYLVPFRAVVQRAGARSVMTAYNSLGGIPCSANDWLLNKKLKGDWQFKGFVISDAGAVGGANVLHYTAKDYSEATQRSLNGGLDVIFQTAYDHYRLFIPPFLNDSIRTSVIDAAVRRVLTAKFELGLFENPYVQENNNDVDAERNKAFAKQAALESIVLLKNEKNILPLKKTVTLALIGTDALEARTGGYSGKSQHPVNLKEGIQEVMTSAAKILYAEGCGRETREWKPVENKYLAHLAGTKIESGLQAEYFNNISLSGQPAVARIDDNVNFNWTLYPPDEKLALDFYSVKWTGKLRGPASGIFKIGLDGNDGFRLYINNTLLIDNWKKQTYSTILREFEFKKDSLYDLRIEFFEPGGNAHIHLVWNMDVNDDWQSKINEAVGVASKSDVIVVAAGITEGEFQDRASLQLPGHQEELILQLAATGKPVIVVLIGGSAVVMDRWLDKVTGVVDAWYPGEQGGNAIADVLFGKYNPAGRLPVTFPVSEAQLPLVYNHLPTGRGDDYNNLSGLPLFPFGYGLSYANFEYNNLRFDKTHFSKTDSVTVTLEVRNSGLVEGDEVVQLYLHDQLASVARPVMELKGFQRIHLLSGETKQVSFILTPETFKLWNEKMKEVVEAGDFRIMVGASSRDIRLKGTVTVE